jgi:hypothetical protein
MPIGFHENGKFRNCAKYLDHERGGAKVRRRFTILVRPKDTMIAVTSKSENIKLVIFAVTRLTISSIAGALRLLFHHSD